MTNTTRLLAALALVSVPALAAAQVEIGSLDPEGGLSIEGRVTDVFGNKFVLEDETGRVLVETGPDWFHTVTVEPGETLTVVGEPDGNGFAAFSIVRQDGSRIEVRDADGPAPWAGGPRGRDGERAGRPGERRAERGDDRGPRGERAASERDEAGQSAGIADEQAARTALEAFGFTDIRLDERGRRHFEFDVRDADGRLVELKIDFDGVVTELEVEDERPAAAADFSLLFPEPVRQALERDGVVDIREFERERRHYEVEGLNRDGQRVEMDIRFDGQVTKIEVKGARNAEMRPAPSEDALRQAVEAGGYRWIGGVEQKPRHHEVVAENPYGETVELHVDFGGEIYKERLRRD